MVLGFHVVSWMFLSSCLFSCFNLKAFSSCVCLVYAFLSGSSLRLRSWLSGSDPRTRLIRLLLTNIIVLNLFGLRRPHLGPKTFLFRTLWSKKDNIFHAETVVQHLTPLLIHNEERDIIITVTQLRQTLAWRCEACDEQHFVNNGIYRHCSVVHDPVLCSEFK